jgi:hypothetical protein
MHQVCTVLVEVETTSAAATNIAVRHLRDMIERAVGSEATVGFRKDHADTQDLGTTLSIVLGSQAIVILAKAIHAFVSRHGDKVIIKTSGGSIIATGSGAKNIDVSRTVEALRATHND